MPVIDEIFYLLEKELGFPETSVIMEAAFEIKSGLASGSLPECAG